MAPGAKRTPYAQPKSNMPFCSFKYMRELSLKPGEEYTASTRRKKKNQLSAWVALREIFKNSLRVLAASWKIRNPAVLRGGSSWPYGAGLNFA